MFRSQLLFFVSFVFTFINCNEPQAGFSLDINLTNSNPGKCYLQRLGWNEEPSMVDSFTITQLDSKITLRDKARTGRTHIYQLLLLPGNVSLFFINDKPNQSATVNTVNPLIYEVIGSAASIALRNLAADQKARRDSLYILQNLLGQKTGDPALRTQIAQLHKSINAVNFRFADTTSLPLSALFIGQQIDFENDRDKQKTFVERLNTRFPKDPLVANFVKDMRDYFSLLDFEFQSGDLLPAAQFTDIRGLLQDTKTGSHRYLLLEFWASYCQKCLSRLAELNNKYPELQRNGLKIISFSLDTDPGMLDEILRFGPLNLPVIADYKGWKGAAPLTYKIDSIPFNMLVNDKGILLKKNLGLSELQDLLQSSRN
jgi:hypothetical protein